MAPASAQPVDGQPVPVPIALDHAQAPNVQGSAGPGAPPIPGSPAVPEPSGQVSGPPPSPVTDSDPVFNPADFLTVDQAAAVLNVSGSTLRRWLRARRLPCVRFGERKTLVSRATVREFVQRGARGTGGEVISR